MDRLRREEIERLTMDILADAYGGHDIVPPVDLVRIVKKYGLNLFSGQFVDANVDGAFNRDKRAIYVKEDAPYVRQAFTIAHELGHYILHQDKEVETFYRRDSMFLSKEERAMEQDANCFAASLLMPKSLVISYWNTLKDVDELAYRFQVSSEAAYWRLKNLGLLG